MLSQATIRFHAVCLVAAVWGSFIWTQATAGAFDRFGKLRGMDFLQFYGAGRIVGEGGGERLYDWNAFAQKLPTLVPGLGDLLFLPIYPPQTALIFVPFARLPYFPALTAWWLLSVALYLGVLWALWRTLPGLHRFRTEAWTLAIGCPAFVQVLAHGQVGILGVPLLLVTWFGVRDRRPVLAGLALGSLLFKPQLGALALAALVVMPSWRLISGLALGAGAQVLLASVVYGWAIWFDYLRVIGAITTYVGSFEPKLWAMHSLRGAVLLIAGHSLAATIAWIALAAVAVVLARRAVRRHAAPQVTFASLCLLGMLVNPHLYVYDLVLLAVPLAVLASWLVSGPDRSDETATLAAYALVWLPLAGPLAAVTHVQLTSPVMMTLLWALGRGPLSPDPSEGASAT
jgi:hypothetical protein